MSSLDYLDLCRLCLVKDRVSVPIFDGEGDVRQIFLKIASCLPVKVAREDKLPKKICDDCVYKVELFYQFWNTTVNAEKQLLQWLGEVNLEDKQGYVTDVLNSGAMKEEQSTENRLDGNVIQHVGEHQNNMSMGMMDNMGLGIPIIISSANQQQQITSVPMDTSGSSVQTVQAVPGPSSQTTHNQIPQNRTSSTQHEDEEETEDEENSDEECDGDDGLNVKEESEDEPSNRTVEPTTFVNVPLVCDEAGPSGLQQQKISEIPEMPMPQSADEDPKSEYFVSKHQLLPRDEDECGANEMYEQVEEVEEELLDRLDVPKADNEQIIITEGIVQCSLCEDSFVSEQALAEHVQMHDEIVEVDEDYKEEMEQFVCEHCGCSFVTMPEFTKHQLEHEAENQEVEMCEEESLTAGQEVNIEYECEICNLSFDSYSGYEEHQTLHHSNDEKQFQCEICNATFRYRQGLRLHAKLHQPDYVPPQRKHHCELCNKRFSRRQVLLVHMKTHGNAGPQNEYVCPVCGKSVSSKTYLTVHLRKHTGEKPHVCDLCGKGFISQNYLSVHRRTHTGERPHKCTHCEKRFTQRTTLVVHLRGHTGDRPYPCTVCHKSFASKTMLNSHLKTHAKQTARQQQQEQQQIQNVQRQDQSLDTITILLPS